MSQPEPSTQGSRPRWTFISVALFVLGLLILLPSGLCTALFGFFTIVEAFGQGGADLSMVPVVLLIGGVPTLIGAVLVWAGWKARARD